MADDAKTKFERIHDKRIYFDEDRYDKPKEIFKVLAERALQSDVLRDGSRVVDIGCATGEFLYHLSGRFPKADYHGYDPVSKFIEQAKERVSGAQFSVGSVLDRSLLPVNSVDVAFLIGVHPMFDEFETCFSNLLHWTRKGGRIYVYTIFNPFPIDVWVYYRRIDDPDPNRRETGWNMFSEASTSRFLDAAIGRGKHTFTSFELPFDLPPHPDDLVRTWTFRDGQGKRLFTNGLSLICRFEILEIRP